MASRLPIDVVIFSPENIKDKLSDERLYEVHFAETLKVNEFPTDEGSLTMNTLAYNAERDLDTIMYSDSGIYRDMQFGKANIIFRSLKKRIDFLCCSLCSFIMKIVVCFGC